MATAKWGTFSTRTSVTLVSVNSLANGSSSGLMTYDNSTLGDLYGLVEVVLGSLTPTTGGSLTLRVYPTANAGAFVSDDLSTVNGGEVYTTPLTTTTSIKNLIFRVSLIAKCSLRFQLTNNAGVALAASGNTIFCTGYSEDIN